MILVIDFNHAPWVGPSPNLATIRSIDEFVGANDSEGDFAGNLFRFSNSLLILIIIRGSLENVDVVVSNVRENLMVP